MFDKVADLFKDSKTDIGSAVCGLEKDEYKDTNVAKAKAQLNKKGEGFATNFCRKIKNSDGTIITQAFMYTNQRIGKVYKITTYKKRI